MTMNQQLAHAAGILRKRAIGASRAFYLAFALAVLVIPEGWTLLAGLLGMLVVAFMVMTLAVWLTVLARRLWSSRAPASSRNRELRLRWGGIIMSSVAAALWFLAGLYVAGNTRLYYLRKGAGVYHESPIDWTWVQILLLVGVFVSFRAVRGVCGRAARYALGSRSNAVTTT